jgi:hypothetical protein
MMARDVQVSVGQLRYHQQLHIQPDSASIFDSAHDINAWGRESIPAYTNLDLTEV